MSNIEKIHCALGGVDIRRTELSFYGKVCDETLAAKIGVCKSCNRKWIEKTPGARKNVPLEVIVVENKVTSCDNVLTD